MKKTEQKVRRLALNRETLRQLDEDGLAVAAGGTNMTCVYSCVKTACPIIHQ